MGIGCWGEWVRGVPLMCFKLRGNLGPHGLLVVARSSRWLVCVFAGWSGWLIFHTRAGWFSYVQSMESIRRNIGFVQDAMWSRPCEEPVGTAYRNKWSRHSLGLKTGGKNGERLQKSAGFSRGRRASAVIKND